MNYQDETINIDTPENVAFGYSVAGIGSRFLAALVDTLLIAIIQLLVILPILFILGYQTVAENLTTWVIALLSLLAFVFFWGYYIFFELLWNGQSPGKRMIGLRVVRQDGTPVTLPEVLIRNLLRIIDLLPSGYGVGVITMFIDSKSRRLGDLAAGTLVVHDRGPVSLKSLEPVPPPQKADYRVAESELPGGLVLENLRYQEFQLLEDYLSRRASLSNRDQLARQILKKIYTQNNLHKDNIPDNADEILFAIFHAAQQNKLEKEQK